MGLDSVELVMEIEKYFGIRIPDAEAEVMVTLQDAANTVAGHLNITSEGLHLREHMLQRVAQCLRGHSEKAITQNDYISSFLSLTDREAWRAFTACMEANIPTPSLMKESKPLTPFEAIGRLFYSTPAYNWWAITVGTFVDCIYIVNYETMLPPKAITSKYEIYLGIAGITSDKLGIDCFEMGPEKSFVDDFGIN